MLLQMCYVSAVILRKLTLLLCFVFLATRLVGLHIHVSGGNNHHEVAAAHQHEHGHSPGHAAHADHLGHLERADSLGQSDDPVSHVTSAFADEHVALHATDGEFDAGGNTLVTAKPGPFELPVWVLVLWLVCALANRVLLEFRFPFQWLRPPLASRPRISFFPPSQGPPRAA